MEPDREASSRLGAAMDQRRLELRPPLKWNQVADRAGLSIGHLSRIRKGEARPSPLAASQIEAALEWPPGTVERIDSGTPPQAAAPAQLPPDIEPRSAKETALEQLLESMREEMRQLKARVSALEDGTEHVWDADEARHQRGA